MKFSIIIPVYKVEAFIEKCLLSCMNQEYDSNDYEIIVVNDGSPDNSLSIIERLVKGHLNITVITQENKGLSGARNTGFKVAQGEYVWFVDSDDWIELHALKTLAPYCAKGYDIITFCAANSISDTQDVIRRPKEDIDGMETTGTDLLNHPSWQPPVWLNIYNREFLIKKNLWMMEGVLHEDSEFEPRAYYLAKRAIALNTVLYHVRINPDSISRSFNPRRAFDILKVSKSLDAFNKKVDDIRANRKISEHICLCLNVAFSNYKLMAKDDQERFLKSLNESKCLMKNFSNSTVRKHRLQFVVYSIMPSLASFITVHSWLTK